jgi:hypothetical protein
MERAKEEMEKAAIAIRLDSREARDANRVRRWVLERLGLERPPRRGAVVFTERQREIVAAGGRGWRTKLLWDR